MKLKNRYRKWSPINKTFFRLAIIGIIITIAIFCYQEYSSYQANKNPLEITPELKTLDCNGFGQVFISNIVNNGEKPIYNIFFTVKTNHKNVSDFEVLSNDYNKNMEQIGGVDVDTGAYFLAFESENQYCRQGYFYSIQPGQSIEIKTNLKPGFCSKIEVQNKVEYYDLEPSSIQKNSKEITLVPFTSYC